MTYLTRSQDDYQLLLPRLNNILTCFAQDVLAQLTEAFKFIVFAYAESFLLNGQLKKINLNKHPN